MFIERAYASGFPYVDSVLNKIINTIINPLISGLFVVAIMIFFWGIFEFVWYKDDVNAKKRGKNNMIWGIFGLFIMTAIFGIMHFIAGTIGADQSVIPG